MKRCESVEVFKFIERYCEVVRNEVERFRNFKDEEILICNVDCGSIPCVGDRYSLIPSFCPYKKEEVELEIVSLKELKDKYDLELEW